MRERLIFLLTEGRDKFVFLPMKGEKDRFVFCYWKVGG
jgi:hypothetical protein